MKRIFLAALACLALVCAGGAFGQTLPSSAGPMVPNAASGGSTAAITDYPINVAALLSGSELAAVQGGVNTTDVGPKIALAITNCNNSSAASCSFYFPTGYYYDASCNRTLTKPFKVYGDGGRAIDPSTQSLTTIACATNAVPLFTSTAPQTGTYSDFACVSIGFTPTSGSSCIVANGTTGKEKIDILRVYAGGTGFYIAFDEVVCQTCRVLNNYVENTISYGIRMQNTVTPDAGGALVMNNHINMAANALAGIAAFSGGGLTLQNNAIISQSITPIVECIHIDYTGVTTQQLNIIGNSCDFVSSFALNIVKGLNFTIVQNNYWGCGHSTATSCLSIIGASFGTIGPDVYNFSASQTSAYTISSAISALLLPSPTQSLPVSIGGSTLGLRDLSTFTPAPNLWLGPVDTRIAGLTPTVADAANQMHCSAFIVNAQVTVSAVEYDIGTSSGNISFGIFNRTTNTWIASTGSIASPGTGVRDSNFTASAVLAPGNKYYGCWAADNTTVTLLMQVQTQAAAATPTSIDNLTTSRATTFPVPAAGQTTPNPATSSKGTKTPAIMFF